MESDIYKYIFLTKHSSLPHPSLHINNSPSSPIPLQLPPSLTTPPSTHRQLEAVIRMSESLAKMRLSPFANEKDVDEALRLFQVSTLDAAMSGSLAG